MLKKHTLRMFSDSLSRMRDADLSEMSNTRGAGAKLKLNGGPRTRKQTPSVLICKKAQYGSLERQVIIIIKKNTKIRTNLFSLLQKCVKKGTFLKVLFHYFHSPLGASVPPDPKFPVLVEVFFCRPVALILIHSSSAGF